jgi:hypothetical protein
MNRTKALVLAAFTVWPIAYMLFFMATVASSFFMMRGGSSQMPSFFGVLIVLHFFTMAEMLGLLVFYILHLFRTEEIAQDKKALWAVVLFMGNAIAMPVYWYLHIWTPLRRREA